MKSLRSLLFSKLLLLVTIPVLVLVLFKLGEVLVKSYETNRDISALKKTINDLEGSHRQLKEFNAFLESDFFAEKEARLKLGLQKKGEIAVILPQSPSPKGQVQNSVGVQQVESQTRLEQKNNPRLWWDYFFASTQD